MRVIRIVRTIRKEERAAKSTRGRSVLKFAREFFAWENHLEHMLEALVFGTLLALSAWPIIAAVGAIKDLL